MAIQHAAGCHAPAGIAWACLRPLELSAWMPLSCVILVTIGIVLLLIMRIFENRIMRSKTYAKAYETLSVRNQRTFVNHHISLIAKIFVLLLAVHPFRLVMCGEDFDTPIHSGSRITIGDLLLICLQVYSTNFLFELFYRIGMSPITMLHHIGALVIGQIALYYTAGNHADSSLEMVMCFFWGFFDVVSEAIPHTTLILYRLYPRHHRLLRMCFRAAYIVSLLSTFVESSVIFWFYGALFERWSIGFRVSTPILHGVFVAAQLWSAWCLRGMENRHYKQLKQSLGDESISSQESKAKSENQDLEPGRKNIQ